MKTMLWLIILLASTGIFAAGDVHLDKAPGSLHDQASLQRGAKNFVNYCLACHSAQAMRYNRLFDIGLSEQQVKDGFIPTSGTKVGEQMRSALDGKVARQSFGVAPPDLSLIARSRGVDWLYTYLRGFYRDDSRPTGWNNVAFTNVAMPHVLSELQGEQVLVHEGRGKDAASRLVLDKPGKMKPAEYDALVADLVNYLDFMGEPAKLKRQTLGVFVLLFLAVLLLVSYKLKSEYWKDVA